MNQIRWYRDLSTFQWFVFLLANAIALPVVIGSVFHLSGAEISALMQRTFLIVGISSFLQGWIGHRYPIADGPAGSWVSVFVVLASVSGQQGQDSHEALQLLEGALLAAGCLLLLLGLTRLVDRLLFLFTPLVTGAFLFMLALQLSGVFLKGMLGVETTGGHLQPTTALLSCGVFVLVILLSTKGRGWMKSYAVLIGILVGWLLYALLGTSTSALATPSSLFQLPALFAWGLPKLNVGMMITTLLFTLILISNTMAAVSAVSQVMPPAPLQHARAMTRGTWMGGVSHVLAALFSSIGIVPLPVSAGFIRLTDQTRKRPFLLAALLLSGISFLPAVVSFLALLPIPIASAVLLASFVQMVGIAFQSFLRVELNQRRLTILGIAMLVGLGLMSLPTTTFQGFPSALQDVLSNGLLVGTLIAILLEQVWKEKPASVPQQNLASGTP